jgi:hypothetical protein
VAHAEHTLEAVLTRLADDAGEAGVDDRRRPARLTDE